MTMTGKRVLITGADGFIGRHLAERCVRDGAEVRAMCIYNSNSSYGWLSDSPLRDNMQFVLGDVRDAGSVDVAVRGCDTVLHLAALISIPYSYEAPRSF